MNLAGLFQFGSKNTDSRVTAGGKGSVSGHVVTGNSSQAVRNLARGQSIQGEIVGKNGSEVQIRIDKDVVISARLDKEIPVSIGQSMTFEVKNSAGAQVALRPLFENMGLDPNVLKALEAAKLPATNELMQMVSAMMKQGMSIDKNALMDMGKMIMANSGASPETMVMMKALNLPITPENIEQFENYQNYKHQLLNNVTDILMEIPGAYQSMLAAGQGNEALDFYTRILNLFTGQTLEGQAEGTADRVFSDIVETVEEQGAAQEILPDGEKAGMVQKEAQAAMDRALNGLAESENPASEKLNAVKEGNGTEKEPAAIQVDNSADGPKGQSLTDGDLLAGILDRGERSQLAAMLGRMGLSERTLAQIAKGSMTAGQLMKEIGQAVQGDDISRADIMKLFGSKEYSQILTKALEQQWLIKPEQVAEKQDVEAFYRKLRTQTAQLLENLGQAAKDTPLAKTLTTVQNNIDFMNQMNQMFQYIQLPLKMSGNEAHGDLYVYANRKSAAKEDGSVSALLHLDMEHLGSMDIHVLMKDLKVSTKFYLRDESIIDFIAAHIHLLDERLQKRGYSFQSEMMVSEKGKGSPNVIETLTAQNKKAKLLAQYSFDVRA